MLQESCYMLRESRCSVCYAACAPVKQLLYIHQKRCIMCYAWENLLNGLRGSSCVVVIQREAVPYVLTALLRVLRWKQLLYMLQGRCSSMVLLELMQRKQLLHVFSEAAASRSLCSTRADVCAPTEYLFHVALCFAFCRLLCVKCKLLWLFRLFLWHFLCLIVTRFVWSVVIVNNIFIE